MTPYTTLEAEAPSLIKRHLGINPQIQYNLILHHQAEIYLLEQHIYNNHEAMHIYNALVKKETIDSFIFGKKDKTWKRRLRNELRLLSKGNYSTVKVTDTIDFIPRSEITQGQDTMYDNSFHNCRPLKSEPYQICLVV